MHVRFSCKSYHIGYQFPYFCIRYTFYSLMKTQSFFRLFTLCLVITVGACTDPLDDKQTVDPAPITPDLTEKVSASVSGFIIDEQGVPVVFASVTAGSGQAVTDEYGYFSVADVSLSKFAGLVTVTKTGYFNGYKTFTPQEDQETFTRIKLLAKPEAVTVNAVAGGTVTTTDGGTITLPANSIVTASTNTAYTGEVSVRARVINNTGEDDKPGDARGTDDEGHAKALKSFSTIAVELTGNAGEPLQIMDGKSATLTLPIAAELQADAPNTISLWSFNTTTGLWQQEGVAEKSGDSYTATVSHFSFWDGAVGLPLVNFSAQIVNAANQPLANVAVVVTIAGMPKNAGYGRFGYTDANGFVSGSVFANMDFVLDIMTPCALSAYSHEFSTAASDTDLGTLTGNLGQSVVSLTGSVKNCEDEAIASGYVQTYDGGFYNRIPIVNGVFSFNGLACTNTEVSIVAVDLSTYKQNSPQQVTLVSGANDLGTLIACETSTMGHITYTFDGTTVTIQEPADTIAAYMLTDNNTTQVATLSGDPNQAQKMSFQFTGGTTLGSNHTLSQDVFSTMFPSGRGYWPVAITVTITGYDALGGFVSGEFSSNMLDFEDNSLHTVSCSFRIRRYL